jgi:hypothetical protein
VPTMTAGHALFATAATGYVLAGLAFEEHELMRSLSGGYAAYQVRRSAKPLREVTSAVIAYIETFAADSAPPDHARPASQPGPRLSPKPEPDRQPCGSASPCPSRPRVPRRR